jgi:acetoin:2,6-dichlorophenolindophenol oxidoreductase subunit alpha
MDTNQKIALLRRMILIRHFEEKLVIHKDQGKILGPFHCSVGQEAVSVGVCGALADQDYIAGSHRAHACMIAKGTNINALVAEIFGKVTGTNGGKGGSMHINDIAVGGLGASAIVGSSIPVACGAAFASKYKKDGRIACVFFGDGAINEGVLYESLNLASIWKLPIIFVLENNGFAISVALGQVSASNDLHLRAVPFGITSKQIDGQNVDEVYAVTKEAIRSINAGNGPVFIEAKTYRFKAHQQGNVYTRLEESGYRDIKEVEHWRGNKDPIKLYADKLLKEGVVTDAGVENIYAEEGEKIENAISFANESSAPQEANLYQNIYVK